MIASLLGEFVIKGGTKPFKRTWKRKSTLNTQRLLGNFKVSQKAISRHYCFSLCYTENSDYYLVRPLDAHH